jgi:dihydrofolate reductase
MAWYNGALAPFRYVGKERNHNHTMRKVIYLVHVSLDGYAAGPNGEIDWIVYNDEVEKYSHDLTSSVDTTLYGRVTYQMMESFWPTVPGNPASAQAEIDYSRWLDNATKIVFSKTLENVEWQNSRVIKDNLQEEITQLKQQPGKDLLILGSPGLAQTFMQLGLIDEYRINVNPVILGSGIPLFGGFDSKNPLKLLEAKTLEGGVVALQYEPQRS